MADDLTELLSSSAGRRTVGGELAALLRRRDFDKAELVLSEHLTEYSGPDRDRLPRRLGRARHARRLGRGRRRPGRPVPARARRDGHRARALELQRPRGPDLVGQGAVRRVRGVHRRGLPVLREPPPGPARPQRGLPGALDRLGPGGGDGPPHGDRPARPQRRPAPPRERRAVAPELHDQARERVRRGVPRLVVDAPALPPGRRPGPRRARPRLRRAGRRRHPRRRAVAAGRALRPAGSPTTRRAPSGSCTSAPSSRPSSATPRPRRPRATCASCGASCAATASSAAARSARRPRCTPPRRSPSSASRPVSRSRRGRSARWAARSSSSCSLALARRCGASALRA